MAFGKLIGDKLYIAPNILNSEGKQYINPPEDLYLQCGYLPLEYTDAPNSREGYHLSSSWLDFGDKIKQTWHYEIDALDPIELMMKINELENKIASTPITYVKGMEVDEKKLYTDGKIIVKAIASGTPIDLNDTNFFD